MQGDLEVSGQGHSRDDLAWSGAGVRFTKNRIHGKCTSRAKTPDCPPGTTVKVPCGTCSTWLHISGQSISLPIYGTMNSSNVTWNCLQCGVPNLLSPPSVTSQNRFSILSSCSDTTDSQRQLVTFLTRGNNTLT